MKTGVVLRKKRWVGGKEGQAVTEYEINTALIESLNSVEKRAAIETGQEVDRQDINLRKANDQVEVLKRAFSFEELRAMQDRMQATIDADQGKAVPLADIIDLKPVLEAGDSRQGARNGRAKIAGPLLQSLLTPDVCSRRPGDAAQHLAVGGGFHCLKGLAGGKGGGA